MQENLSTQKKASHKMGWLLAVELSHAFLDTSTFYLSLSSINSFFPLESYLPHGPIPAFNTMVRLPDQMTR